MHTDFNLNINIHLFIFNGMYYYQKYTLNTCMLLKYINSNNQQDLCIKNYCYLFLSILTIYMHCLKIDNIFIHCLRKIHGLDNYTSNNYLQNLYKYKHLNNYLNLNNNLLEKYNHLKNLKSIQDFVYKRFIHINSYFVIL